MAAGRILIAGRGRSLLQRACARLVSEGFEAVPSPHPDPDRFLPCDTPCDLLVLVDDWPGSEPLHRLDAARRRAPDLRVVLATSATDVASVVAAMKHGASDVLGLPLDPAALVGAVRDAVKTHPSPAPEGRHRALRPHPLKTVAGRSPAMRELIEKVKRVARCDPSTVLLEGESGSGKSHLARVIHAASPRASRPLVIIPCAAVTETLLESELFGHERGAFTDARATKKGLMELADGGIAFLDEVSEMGPAMQAKLLNFLEERRFKRVGGTRDIGVDVRVIAATNRVLAEDVRTGRFREDLYYRLSVIPLHLPPLRERKEDIPELAEQILETLRRKCGWNEPRSVTPEAMAVLCAQAWPGNVRELGNVIESVTILHDAPRIGIEHLPGTLSAHAARPSTGPAETLPALAGTMPLDRIERGVIEQALEMTGRNQVRAARLLGCTRHCLRARMKRYGMLPRAPSETVRAPRGNGGTRQAGRSIHSRG